MYQYRVVPFIGKIKKGQSASEVSNQIAHVIHAHAVDGWEFYQLTDVNIEVSSGCLASLFGSSVSYQRFDQIIFRRLFQA